MHVKVRPFLRKSAVIALLAIAPIISGCVESRAPLLTRIEPLFGPQFEAHLYDTFIAGKARNVQVAQYRWRGDGYERVGYSGEKFVVQPINETDFIVQTDNTDNAIFHYSVARKIVDGVFLVLPIEESDAPPETRAAICGNDQAIICTIESYDQLVTLARATVEKSPHNPLLGVIVRNGE
ncbi:MAG: hypothetical protein KGQ47_13625 [Hyphomicrobiales bacterium]|nr:hypothetical protein [Hyphomicrobiales bacterium]